ncbi:MAG: hypothetical protein ABFE13_01580 [Phycisphaerales bacterium]
MALTLAQELELVEAAIQRTLEAQSSTSPDGRSRTNPNLAALYEQRRDLLLRIDFAANGRVRALEVVD